MKQFKEFEQWAADIVGVYEAKTTIKEDDVGREFQHIEDLTYIHGPQGALKAIERLAQITQDSSHLEVKWDGCIDPDLILKTNLGALRIEEVIDRHQQGEHIMVMAYDEDSNKDCMIAVDLSTKRHGNKLWVEIELENGDILRLTADHEVFTTNRGWVEAQDLTEDDDIKELSENK
jgi:hypothetical protein